MAALSFATLQARFAARYPNATLDGGGTVASLAASAGTVPTLEAAARGYASFNGKLVWVKLSDDRRVRGETAPKGEIVQLEETEAKRIVLAKGAVYATDEEVRAAQAPPKGKS